MAWFDETCINSDNVNMNDCGATINCVAPLHCTLIAVIDIIGGCKLNLNNLKMKNKTSQLPILLGITYAPAILIQ